MAGKFGELVWFGALLLVVITLAPAATRYGNSLFSATDGVAGDGTPTQKIEVVTEKSCGSTTLTADFDVKHSQGTDLTARNLTVFLNGEKKIVSEGSTFTGQGNQKMIVYPVLDPADTSYLGGQYEGVIPCTGTTAAFSTSDTSFMKQVGGSALLSDPSLVYEANSAASTATVINDDFTANPGTGQAIGTGDTRIVTVRLFPVYKEGYGVADGNTLACRFTDYQIDQAGVTVSLNGANLGDAKYTPSQTRFAVSDTNESLKYWHFDAVDGKATNVLEFKIGIKGDDTNNPDVATNFSCQSFGTDYYEANDGAVKVDVEDRDDNSKIGRTAANEFIFNVALS